MRAFLVLACIVAAGAAPATGQGGRAAPRAAVSAPIGNVRYDVTFDEALARGGGFHVAMSFDVTGAAPVLLSLPAWTPGAYEIGDFARYLSEFNAVAWEEELDWDKLDPDTWRVRPRRAGRVTVRYRVEASQLDNAKAWSRPDFLFFNGTNAFMHPEGRSAAFGATVHVATAPGWRVATGLPSVGPGTWRHTNYHDLVDAPFFVGAFDIDSAMVNGTMHRVASYPAGALAGAQRAQFWNELQRTVPAMTRVFGETPWRDYTTLLAFTGSGGSGSALEHGNSHLGIYDPVFRGTELLASITAHEIIHAWNVKRLRPADLVPYRYAAPQPTPWLWVSEGITDYYADIALVRGGVIDTNGFLATTAGKIATVAAAPPVALEDASLSIWIHPTDGTDAIYYPKGSLAGLLLDVMIRDASDGARSLDDVMRTLYRTTARQGRGFTAADWWGAVSRAAGGRSFTEFNRRYIDGRHPFPYNEVLAKVGVRYVIDSTRVPRMGIQLSQDSTGSWTVGATQPGGAFAVAGIIAGDRLLSVGEIVAGAEDLGAAFRARYGQSASGTMIPVRVRRGGEERTFQVALTFAAMESARLEFDPGADARAVRLRAGWLK